MSLRPNPLSPGRASPFRRPESPSLQQQQQQRPSTPTFQSNRPATPSRLNNSSFPNGDGTWSPTRAAVPPSSPSTVRNGAAGINNISTIKNNSGLGSPYTYTSTSSPVMGGINSSSNNKKPPYGASTATTITSSSSSSSGGGDALGKLPAAQVRELREAFAILDRTGGGGVGREDVADMLGQVGLANDAAAVSAFFPPAGPSSSSSGMPMAAFLGGIAGSLAKMSKPDELLAALAAFDDDDSGQIDTAELADALVGGGAGGGAGVRLSRADVDAVMQDFTGKRAFNKYSTGAAGGALGRGEVFRYREWVAGLGPVGGNQGEKAQAA